MHACIPIPYKYNFVSFKTHTNRVTLSLANKCVSLRYHLSSTYKKKNNPTKPKNKYQGNVFFLFSACTAHHPLNKRAYSLYVTPPRRTIQPHNIR